MLCFEKDFLSKNKSVSFVLLPDFFLAVVPTLLWNVLYS